MYEVDDQAQQRTKTNLEELTERIGRVMAEDGTIEPVPGLHLTRASKDRESVYGVLNPGLCIIAQGAKDVFMGERSYRYDPGHYLLATVEMPVKGVRLIPEQGPYLAMMVELDPALVGSVMVEAGLVAPHRPTEAKALGVSPLDSELLDAATRLLRFADSAADSRVLVPLVKREIVYRLLTGAQGDRLRQLPAQSGHSHLVARALKRLRQDFNQQLSIEDLAKELGMSSTRFHHHFKAVTDMSPLQFQKQLRLQEARRLMLGEDLDASTAGYRVGYEDPSHFSRDYKKHFGASPMRDVERLRLGLEPAAIS